MPTTRATTSTPTCRKAPYKVGDRVICIAPHDGNDDIVGLTGTVCGPIYGDWCGVKYDAPILGGHSCRGNCNNHYGWETAYQCLEPYVEPQLPAVEITYEELNI